MPARSSSGRLSWVADGTLLWAFAALLILPLFTAGFLENWGSIESIFMAHARYLVDHWPAPGWQPNWYGGTRFNYVYPPALPYGTALLSLMLGITVVQAYHLYTAVFYALGIAGVYVLVRTLSGSRSMGWAAALATTLISPSFWLLELIRIDALERYLAPQRLNVLVHWGEGPHITALSVLGFALAACYWALAGRRGWARVPLAAALCALVVSNNFYGSVTLAILYALLVWALWVTAGGAGFAWRAVAIPALAYGLTAWWLTPSYVRVTMQNLRIVGASGEATHLATAVAGLLAFGGLTYLYARGRPERFYAVFAGGAALVFAVVVAGHYWYGWQVTGSPARFVPELDLALTLAGLALAWAIAKSLLPLYAESRGLGLASGAAVALLALAGSDTYVPNAWRIYLPALAPEQRIEFEIADWIAEHAPGRKWFVDGSVRLWFNLDHDLIQFGGGSDQGMLNPAVVPGFWDVRLGEDADRAVLWLQALGTDGVVVNGEGSAEIFHGRPDPKKFSGVLEAIYDNGSGDVIFAVPRRYPGLARVVRKAEVASLPLVELREQTSLEAYVRALESGPDRPARMEWSGPNMARISAEFDQGHALVVQVAYDPAWRATVGDTELAIRADPLGQMLMDVAPGSQEIELRFGLPLEELLGRLLTGLSILAAAALVFASPRGQ